MDLDKRNLVKLGYDGSVLGLKQYMLLALLPQKMMLPSKVVKNDSKMIILLHWSKSLTHSVKTIV